MNNSKSSQRLLLNFFNPFGGKTKIPGTGILVFILLMSWLNAGLGQTTYTWNQTGTASWATTTNWT
ncbi:MAG: hypothetical protein WBP41_20200, partial [Saprospiraceae bacterium]